MAVCDYVDFIKFQKGHIIERDGIQDLEAKLYNNIRECTNTRETEYNITYWWEYMSEHAVHNGPREYHCIRVSGNHMHLSIASRNITEKRTGREREGIQGRNESVPLGGILYASTFPITYYTEFQARGYVSAAIDRLPSR